MGINDLVSGDAGSSRWRGSWHVCGWLAVIDHRSGRGRESSAALYDALAEPRNVSLDRERLWIDVATISFDRAA